MCEDEDPWIYLSPAQRADAHRDLNLMRSRALQQLVDLGRATNPSGVADFDGGARDD